MKKQVKKLIFEKRFDGDYAYVKFGDLPKELQDSDIISINRDPGHCSENNSWEAFTELQVYRKLDETDEEETKRLKKELEEENRRKERRRESYLSLKKEFENEK